MFKKLFRFKRKQHDSTVRSSAPKKSMDSASAAILSRQFPPLESRVDSPSDLLNVVGNPSTVKNEPVTSNDATQSNEKPLYQLAIRNIASPITIELTPIETQNEISVTKADSQHAMNLDTSREDKTLIEKVMSDRAEFERLKQKILEFEQEKQMWDEKLQLYAEQEKQMKSIIHKNQVQIEQLQYRHALAQQRSNQTQLNHLTRPFDNEEEEIYDSSNEQEEDDLEDYQEEEEEDIEEARLQDYKEYQRRMNLFFDANRHRESHSYQEYPHHYHEPYRKTYGYPYSHPNTHATSSYPLWHRWQQYRSPYHVEQSSYYYN